MNPASEGARPPTAHPTRTMLVLSLGAMSFSLSQTILIPALPEIIRIFDSNPSSVAWTFTGFLISAAICTPLVGRLGDMFGRQRMLVLVLMVFAAGNVACAVSGSLELIVLGRILQGAAGGIFPLCFAIIREQFPSHRVRINIGLVSATAGLGAGFGLVLGGPIVDHASYQWLFWTVSAVAAIAAIATLTWIPESPERTPGGVDVRGALVLALGIALPLIAISQAHTWGWTGARTLLLTAAGLVVLAGWVRLERNTREPMVDVATLSRPAVLATNAVTLFTGVGLLGAFTLVPQLAMAPPATGYGFGSSATSAGLLLAPGGFLMLLVGPLSGILGNRLGNRVSLALGGAITGCGLLMLGEVHGSELQVVIAGAVVFSGIGLTYAAMPNLIVDAVPSHQTGEATGFNAVMRLIGASLGAQVSASILAGSTGAVPGFPSEGAFRMAFDLSAGVAIFAAAMALFIPRIRPEPAEHLGHLEEIAAAAPLLAGYGVNPRPVDHDADGFPPASGDRRC